MSNAKNFRATLEAGNSFEGDFITLGAAMFEGEVLTHAHINVPLKTLNRHGLIAGATGTGKTKTLQVLAENLSLKGIPVLLMDIKGDLSGLAKPGVNHPKITERQDKIGLSYEPTGFPVELLSLSEQGGVRLRATVTEFGPILFSQILDASDVQAGIISVLFKYCDDHDLPLLDLKDFKKVLLYANNEGNKEIEKEYGSISTASTGAILRKIVALEQQGAALFFGEKSFDVQDIKRLDTKGHGAINIVRLTDIQDRPKLFSTFMLSLLAEIYSTFPEQGDSGQPELVIFIDEAHLIFDQASKALHDQIENMVKLIRSKGVGLYFITQNPTDVPEGVLSQLGLKIQHALRAFTAKDRKAIKLTAQNYPISEFYDTESVLTSLGIGEALVSALDEKGRPTPLAATLMRAPVSRMDILSPEELEEVYRKSELTAKYNETIDRESAYELLTKKLEEAKTEEIKQKTQEERKKMSSSSSSDMGQATQKAILKVLTSTTVIRSVLGILGKMIK
ncbi:helicase HerA-like domain-containing protein [Flavimarina sp. Hel_I_48]|uniref:helicase HerA-like domain-containing protein n=1 Tax=Flavimarina sp. Hel_I_48 TaxID=1392488 RepID=UPI0004DF5FDD|nr:helicase HerA-like domain-containing protein [Flavimarina sp. Hel_I_48]